MGKLEEFDILFDHPRGVYYSGQILRGQVIMSLAEPMKMRSLRIFLFGRAKVRWTERKGSGKRRRSVTYRTEEVFIEEDVYVFGGAHTDAQEHPAGNHSYQFQLPLSTNLPSSFEGEYGYVRYVAKAIIDKPWKFDHETITAFTIINQVDLNKEPSGALTGMEGSDSSEASCCCCIGGIVTASTQILRRGYVPGENILINAQVQNGSNTDVLCTRVALKQYIEFFGVSDSLFSSGYPKQKTVSDIVAEITREGIPPEGVQTWENVPMRIPPLPPSRLVGCNCINIAYVLKFYVNVNCGDEIKLTSDITIGTIPLRSVYENRTGVVVDQPTAPPMPFAEAAAASASAPIDDWVVPPPSYEATMTRQVSILEEDDSEYTRGSHQFAPAYPYYSFDNVDAQYNQL